MALAIVALHAGFLTDVSDFAAFLCIDGIFRIAVPVFLIINGFYFYNIVTRKDRLAWFKRVIILYLVWMILYAPVWITDENLSRGEFIRIMFTGYWQLWYLAGMVGAALLVISIGKINPYVGLSIAVGCFLSGVCIQYAGHFLDGSLGVRFRKEWPHRNFLFFSFPYFYFGYVIKKYSLHRKFNTQMTVFFVCLSLVVVLLESAASFYYPGKGGGHDNFLSLILISPAMFILFLNFNWDFPSKNLAIYASGIFFCHIYILLAVNKFGSFGGTTKTFLVAFLSFMATSVVVKLNKRFKCLL